MKRIAIVTIISENYGNRLQNFALQKVLQSRNVIVETIPMRAKNIIVYRVKIIIKELLSWIVTKYKKSICWNKFDLKIVWSGFTTEDVDINDAYDYFVAGSDQIWNPLFPFNSEREFLTFATDEKKIAYAASIGVEQLPVKYRTVYKKNIDHFKVVSVRENKAADIIESIGCERPSVVLDPTMLLTDNEWREEAKHSRIKIKNKYIVKYFLGECNEGYEQYIEHYARDIEADVIDIMNSEFKEKIGPLEFVRLIHDSEVVFTDSFHGTVFSILFHKPFVVFERPFEEGYGKMTSRIDTLLQTFQLDEQRVFSAEECDEVNPIWDCKMVERILMIEQKKSMKFLMDAIGM